MRVPAGDGAPAVQGRLAPIRDEAEFYTLARPRNKEFWCQLPVVVRIVFGENCVRLFQICAGSRQAFGHHTGGLTQSRGEAMAHLCADNA